MGSLISFRYLSVWRSKPEVTAQCESGDAAVTAGIRGNSALASGAAADVRASRSPGPR